MARVAFVPSPGPSDSLDLHLDGVRTGTLDQTLLADIRATPEPNPPTDIWLVKTGRDLFQLLQLTPATLDSNDRLLELDFTRLPPSSNLHTLPWELLHDGVLFLANKPSPLSASSGRPTANQPHRRTAPSRSSSRPARLKTPATCSTSRKRNSKSSTPPVKPPSTSSPKKPARWMESTS